MQNLRVNKDRAFKEKCKVQLNSSLNGLHFNFKNYAFRFRVNLIKIISSSVGMHRSQETI